MAVADGWRVGVDGAERRVRRECRSRRTSHGRRAGDGASDTDLVVVTGVSGGGRSTVARALENVGFYVVDNLPQALMLDMAAARFKAGGAARRTAMVLDVRSRAFSTDLAGAVRALKERGFSPRVVFVDADDEVLIRRFESVRRSHPLQGDGRLADGIAAERKLLEEAREQADVIIDTSHLNVNQLRAPGRGAVRRRGRPPAAGHRAVLRLQVRPAAGRRLRAGRALPAQPVLGAGAARAHRPGGGGQQLRAGPARARATSSETYARLIAATAPGFEREGKRYLTVAVGCTGGKHRSVAIAEELAARLRDVAAVRPRLSTATWGASDGGSEPAASGWWRSAAGTGSRASLRALRALRRASSTSTSPRWSRSATTAGPAAGCGPSGAALPPGDLRQALAALAADDAGRRSATADAAAAPVRRRSAATGATRWPGTRSATWCCSG